MNWKFFDQEIQVLALAHINFAMSVSVAYCSSDCACLRFYLSSLFDCLFGLFKIEVQEMGVLIHSTVPAA
jgi:hypothetical protein